MQFVLAFVAIMVSVVCQYVFLGMSGALNVPEVEPIVIEHEVKKRRHVEEPKFWSFRSREIERLVDDLESREKQVRIQESELLEIRTYVDAEKKELIATKKELDDLRAEIQANLIKIEKEEQANLVKLADMYSRMPPATVIQLFDDMDDVYVLKIINFMDTEFVAGLFQLMISSDPEGVDRVTRLSKMMRVKTEA